MTLPQGRYQEMPKTLQGKIDMIVLEAMTRLKSKQAVADELEIGRATVYRHLARIKRVYGIQFDQYGERYDN